TEDPIEICPECGKKTRRIISGGAGFLFKGSGFYQTDYRSKQYQADAKKDKPSEAAKTSDTKSSADTKKKETGSGTSSNTKSE
ncbi:MAG: zinc ribbon domain-containing protein, partial [Candidatus Zixiibacteriota bacterium]